MQQFQYSYDKISYLLVNLLVYHVLNSTSVSNKACLPSNFDITVLHLTKKTFFEGCKMAASRL